VTKGTAPEGATSGPPPGRTSTRDDTGSPPSMWIAIQAAIPSTTSPIATERVDREAIVAPAQCVPADLNASRAVRSSSRFGVHASGGRRILHGTRLAEPGRGTAGAVSTGLELRVRLIGVLELQIAARGRMLIVTSAVLQARIATSGDARVRPLWTLTAGAIACQRGVRTAPRSLTCTPPGLTSTREDGNENRDENRSSETAHRSFSHQNPSPNRSRSEHGTAKKTGCLPPAGRDLMPLVTVETTPWTPRRDPPRVSSHSGSCCSPRGARRHRAWRPHGTAGPPGAPSGLLAARAGSRSRAHDHAAVQRATPS